MDPHSDRVSPAQYNEALLGISGYLDTAPGVLAWVVETMAAPVGDPATVGRNPVVVLHGDHHTLVRDTVWGRELLPFDNFFESVPKVSVNGYQWSVSDRVRSHEANDFVTVRVMPHGHHLHETLASRYVDWEADHDRLGDQRAQGLYQDLYDGFRRGGAPPQDARVLAAAVIAPGAERGPA